MTASTTPGCTVLTFKEGLLSAVAHDLRITVGGVSVEIEPDTDAIVARFEASSLRVACARKDGRDDPGTLSAKQRTEIEDTVRRKVLHTSRYPQIEFESTRVEGHGDERSIEGMLQLHGVRRPIRTIARRIGDLWSAEVEIHQPDYGIEPYSAMFGTLRVSPRVRVRVDVPTPS